MAKKTEETGRNHGFDLDLWTKGHRIFRASVNLGMPFLATINEKTC